MDLNSNNMSGIDDPSLISDIMNTYPVISRCIESEQYAHPSPQQHLQYVEQQYQQIHQQPQQQTSAYSIVQARTNYHHDHGQLCKEELSTINTSDFTMDVSPQQSLGVRPNTSRTDKKKKKGVKSRNNLPSSSDNLAQQLQLHDLKTKSRLNRSDNGDNPLNFDSLNLGGQEDFTSRCTSSSRVLNPHNQCSNDMSEVFLPIDKQCRTEQLNKYNSNFGARKEYSFTQGNSFNDDNCRSNLFNDGHRSCNNNDNSYIQSNQNYSFLNQERLAESSMSNVSSPTGSDSPFVMSPQSSSIYHNGPEELDQYTSNTIEMKYETLPHSSVLDTRDNAATPENNYSNLLVTGCAISSAASSPSSSLYSSASLSSPTSESQSSQRGQRMSLTGLTEDEKYDRTRQQNNDASRRYRQNKKEKVLAQHQQVTEEEERELALSNIAKKYAAIVNLIEKSPVIRNQ